LTPQDRLDREAQKLADMCITVSITRNSSGVRNPIIDELETALGRAGVLEREPAPDLSPSERARVAVFGLDKPEDE
jgi:hypothetical protein